MALQTRGFHPASAELGQVVSSIDLDLSGPPFDLGMFVEEGNDLEFFRAARLAGFRGLSDENLRM